MTRREREALRKLKASAMTLIEPIYAGHDAILVCMNRELAIVDAAMEYAKARRAARGKRNG